MRFLRKVVPLVLVISLFVATAAGCGSKQQNSTEGKVGENSTVDESKKNDLFVDVAWLKANMQKVVIIDARKDTEYKVAHIPGALNNIWQYFADVTKKPGDTGFGILLPKEKLAEKIGALGIDADTQVVVYADPNGWGEDGRIVWTLRRSGVKNVKMLDGGFPGWKKANGEVSKEITPAPKAVEFKITTMDEDLNVTTDYIKNNMKKIKIVDARTTKEFDGATDYGEKRGGHLPGAINIPFKEVFNDDGNMKSIAEIKKLFTDAGLKPEDEIVTYCTKGIRSAHMALVLRMAGFENARNYDASFYEWAGNDSLTLEK